MMKTDFIYGADISSLASLEKLGVAFKNQFGNSEDLFIILKNAGFTHVRLRLFNDPYSESGEPYGGGTNDLETTLKLAKRANEHGFPVVLVFHYSDFWSDPRKQMTPKAWQKAYFDESMNRVFIYTTETLEVFRAANINISHIQIGNEVNNGMLWPDGRLYENDEELSKKEAEIPDERWAPYTNLDISENEIFSDRYANLGCFLNAGIIAANKIYPKSKIIIHLDRGGDQKLYQTFFKCIDPLLVNYDVIGLSYYPYWHGSLDMLSKNIRFLKRTYKKEIMIMETSYAYSGKKISPPQVVTKKKTPVPNGFPPFTKSGQSKYLTSLIKTAKELQINGLFYWEPAWIFISGDTWATEAGRTYLRETTEKDGNKWANQALFDENAQALPALYAYLNFKLK